MRMSKNKWIIAGVVALLVLWYFFGREYLDNPTCSEHMKSACKDEKACSGAKGTWKDGVCA